MEFGLIDLIGEWILGDLEEFDGKKMVAVHRAQVNLGDETEKKEREEKRKEADAFFGDLLKKIQELLVGDVAEVRLSDWLTESAGCLVSAEGQPDPHLLRDQALLVEGSPVKEPARFTRLVSEMMAKG